MQLEFVVDAIHGYLLGVFVLGGFSFLLALFVLPLVSEKRSQVNHVQWVYIYEFMSIPLPV